MMKRIKLLIFGLLLALPCSVCAQDFIYGDVNGDDEVNVADVNAVIGAIMGDFQYVNITGSWVSVYGVDPYGQYDIHDADAVAFDFQDNRKGIYTFQLNHDVCYTEFTWEQQFRRIFIWYYDGFHEELYYRIDPDGYLLLALDKQFSYYTAYRPGTLAGAAATHTGTSRQDATSRPASRAIKDRP